MTHFKKSLTTAAKNRDQLKQQIREELEAHSLREELIKEVKAEMEQEKNQVAIRELEVSIARLEIEFKKNPEENEDVLESKVYSISSYAKELYRSKVISKDAFFEFCKRLKKIDD